jgi:hypothetical protein
MFLGRPMSTSRRALLASVALLLLGCGGGDRAAGGGGRGTVLLKDAPAASGVRAAVVTIAEVDLVGEQGNVVLRSTPVTTDLLTLANDVATLVDGAVVPAGTYSQLRFVITGGYLDVDGTIFASSPDYAGLPPEATVGGVLRMPSYAESGLKVLLPAGGLEVGTDARIVLVDFDVAQSFGHEAGHSGAWVMHPVVKATEVQLTGELEVTLALGPGVALPAPLTLADFSAVVTPSAGGDAVAAPLVDRGGGTFGASYAYLLPGDYTVTFLPPAAITAFSTDPAVPATVTVVSGQETTASFLLLSATGGEPEPPPNPL